MFRRSRAYHRVEYVRRSGARAELVFTSPLQHRDVVEVHYRGDRIAVVDSAQLRRWLMASHQPEWAVENLIWRIHLRRRRWLPPLRRVHLMVRDEGDCPLTRRDVQALLRMTT